MSVNVRTFQPETIRFVVHSKYRSFSVLPLWLSWRAARNWARLSFSPPFYEPISPAQFCLSRSVLRLLDLNHRYEPGFACAKFLFPPRVWFEVQCLRPDLSSIAPGRIASNWQQQFLKISSTFSSRWWWSWVTGLEHIRKYVWLWCEAHSCFLNSWILKICAGWRWVPY